MSHQITITGTGRQFDIEPGESILDAALANGVRIRYGCRRGKCSMCKHLVVRGEIDDSQVSPYALQDDERDNDIALLCLTFAKSDCEIELLDSGTDDGGVEPAMPATFAGVVEAVTPVSDKMVMLRLGINGHPEMLAGQYVELEIPDHAGRTRSYSIAGQPTDQHLELVVKRIPDGAFSGRVDEYAGRQVAIRGPFGEMFLRPNDRPVLLVGAGSGIGPLRAILLDLERTKSVRPVRLFYGARSQADLPFVEELAQLVHAMPDFEVQVTLSKPVGEWEGRVGRVTALVAAQFGEEHDLDAYVCGAPEMCDDVRFILEARGVPENQIHCDAFYAAD